MPSHFRGPLLGARSSGFYGSTKLVNAAPQEIVRDGNFQFYYNSFDTALDFDSSVWTSTTVGTTAGNSITVGTGALALSQETVLSIDAGTANSTGYGSIQATSAPGLFLANDKKGGFVARINISDVSGGTAFVGLARSDTTVLASDGTLAIVNGLGFRIAAGDIRRISYRSGATDEDISTGLTASDQTFVNLGMEIRAGSDQSVEGTSGTAIYYVNGVEVGQSQFIPDNTSQPLLVTMAVVNGASGTTDLRVSAIGFWGER